MDEQTLLPKWLKQCRVRWFINKVRWMEHSSGCFTNLLTRVLTNDSGKYDAITIMR